MNRVSLTLVFYYQVPGELELNYNCMNCFDCESSSGYLPKAALKLSLDTLGVIWNAPGLGTLYNYSEAKAPNSTELYIPHDSTQFFLSSLTLQVEKELRWTLPDKEWT